MSITLVPCILGYDALLFAQTVFENNYSLCIYIDILVTLSHYSGKVYF